MRILALNCGSSSIKSALIDTAQRRHLFDLRVENIATPECRLVAGDTQRPLGAATDFDAAVKLMLDELRARPETQADAVVHRVVHGGERFVQPSRLDEQTVDALDELERLAPLHNPPAIAAVRAARAMFPRIPHVAVFDTAFHATLPPQAREYALPRELVRRRGIRRYGFHGSSHAHVAAAAATHLHTTPQGLRIVSCHLGNGASVAAIEHGRSVETSMGMTPLEGLIMGTRAGDLDPGVLLELLSSRELDAPGLAALLNKQSGLQGLTGAHDMRDIEHRAAAGDEDCRLAITLYAHRLRKYIGAYAAVMGGVDVIAFTGGIGEHSALLRHRATQRLDFLGAQLDEDRNRDARISPAAPVADVAEPHSRVRLLVIRADEELAMALETAALLVP